MFQVFISNLSSIILLSIGCGDVGRRNCKGEMGKLVRPDAMDADNDWRLLCCSGGWTRGRNPAGHRGPRPGLQGGHLSGCSTK